MNYGSQIWGQLENAHIKRIIKLNDKAVRTINFAHYRDSASQYYKKSNILKFQDNISINNYSLIHDHFSNHLPSALLNKYEYIHNGHNHPTKLSNSFCVKVPKSRTLDYGIYSIQGQASRTWNHYHTSLIDKKLHLLSRTSCKNIIKTHILNSY